MVISVGGFVWRIWGEALLDGHHGARRHGHILTIRDDNPSISCAKFDVDLQQATVCSPNPRAGAVPQALQAGAAEEGVLNRRARTLVLGARMLAPLPFERILPKALFKALAVW